MEKIHIQTRLETLTIIRNNLYQNVLALEIDITRVSRMILIEKDRNTYNQFVATIESWKATQNVSNESLKLVDELIDGGKKEKN